MGGTKELLRQPQGYIVDNQIIIETVNQSITIIRDQCMISVV
jgi:hypothetical protein